MTDDTQTFDEAAYLKRYADVAKAVADGRFASGLAHFNICGRNEGRRSGGFYPFEIYLERLLTARRGNNAPDIDAVLHLESAPNVGGSNIFEEFRSLFPLCSADFQHLVVKLFSAGMLSFVSRAIACQYNIDNGVISIGVHSRPDSYLGLLKWQIPSAKRFEIYFNDKLIRNGCAPPDRIAFFVKHFIQLLPLIVSYLRAQNVTIGETWLNIDDNAVSSGLAYCSNRNDSFLIPDNYFISSCGYSDLRGRLLSGARSWEERLPIVFWRGATTGRPGASWRELQRVRLCEVARSEKWNVVSDFGLSKIVQIDNPEERTELMASGLLKDAVPASEFTKYKYQVDIDGNTNSWPGLYLKLLTGSPVLKVGSPANFRQWYYPRLIPWAHYVPVRADLSDFGEKVNWLCAHPDFAERIGEAGRAFALSLDYDSEVKIAHENISASITYFSCCP